MYPFIFCFLPLAFSCPLRVLFLIFTFLHPLAVLTPVKREWPDQVALGSTAMRLNVAVVAEYSNSWNSREHNKSWNRYRTFGQLSTCRSSAAIVANWYYTFFLRGVLLPICSLKLGYVWGRHLWWRNRLGVQKKRKRMWRKAFMLCR